MSDVFKQYPKLPIGLEYEFADRPILCLDCGKIVQQGESLIRRNNRRNELIQCEFSSKEGVCLLCAKIRLARIVQRCFQSAETGVQQYAALDANNANDPMKNVLEKMVESLQIIIDSLSNYVAQVDKEQPDYVSIPDPTKSE